MANYKNIRLEEYVYNQLLKQQKPRESMSQVIERLLNNLSEAYEHARALNQIIGGDSEWDTKR